MHNPTSEASAALAFRWRTGSLQPIVFPSQVHLDDLLGIERQKQELLKNTRQFVAGAPANHALLTGSRGTGKSSLVKALLTSFGRQGLRLVEVHPHDLTELPDVVAPLRGRRERFILYVDDFSVAANDPALTALKAALDGGIEEPPDNVLIYATSNRRHLMPEFRQENDEYRWNGDELHPGETTEEKIALSERFGLWLSFPPFNQDQYLDLVRAHLARLGVRQWDEDTEKAALRWALARASRSGRVAQQFAKSFAGARKFE
jgi:predicted AAA+ superfamily ATPase